MQDELIAKLRLMPKGTKITIRLAHLEHDLQVTVVNPLYNLDGTLLIKVRPKHQRWSVTYEVAKEVVGCREGWHNHTEEESR